MSDLKIETVKISELSSDPDNARSHSSRNIQAIRNSLERFGQRRPLVVRDGVVIAGNGTLQAATELGWKTIAVTQVPQEWTLDEARAYAITDNRTAELADWDGEVLLATLQELDPQLLEASGFTASDVEDLEMLWGGAPDLDDLAAELGEDEDEGWVTVKLRLPILVHDKWVAAVKATGLQDENEAINLVVQAAFDALTTESFDA